MLLHAELPECATRVLTDPSGRGVSQRICFPGNATISRIEQQSLIVALGNCSADASSRCDQVCVRNKQALFVCMKSSSRE